MFRRKPKPKKTDYNELAKLLEQLYENHYAQKWVIYRMSFIKGIFAGLGGVIGATIVVAILAWLLSLTQNVPFLQDISRNTKSSLEQNK